MVEGAVCCFESGANACWCNSWDAEPVLSAAVEGALCPVESGSDGC